MKYRGAAEQLSVSVDENLHASTNISKSMEAIANGATEQSDKIEKKC